LLTSNGSEQPAARQKDCHTGKAVASSLRATSLSQELSKSQANNSAVSSSLNKIFRMNKIPIYGHGSSGTSATLGDKGRESVRKTEETKATIQTEGKVQDKNSSIRHSKPVHAFDSKDLKR
jgi:hypothetical protein